MYRENEEGTFESSMLVLKSKRKVGKKWLTFFFFGTAEQKNVRHFFV